MIFQMSDIKVVFSNPQYGKRDSKLANEKLLNGKTLQIILKVMIISSRSILFRFSWICNVLWDRLMANISRMFRFITFPYSNCCILRVRTMRNNSEPNRNKSAQYKVKSRHYKKWLLVRTCLHGGGGPQIGEVTCGGSPHLSCKRDQIKMRDYVDRRVTHQSGLPHLPEVPNSM